MTPSQKFAAQRHSDPRKEIVRRIERLSHRFSRWDVFSDFVELSAISMSNAVDVFHRDEREARYLQIVKKYAPDELSAFPEMLGELVDALEAGFDDVLGRVFHDLELHNKYQGQFFTPFAGCQTMAQMTLSGEAKEKVAGRGFITVQEPACGSGAMIIAAAEVLKGLGLNYQQCMHATLVDVDAKCVHMAYVQLALLHVPAVVVHGNTLSLEERSHWRTPAHFMGGWEWRLRRAEAARAEAQQNETPAAAEPVEAPIDEDVAQLVLL